MTEREERRRDGCTCSPYVVDHDRDWSCRVHRGKPDPGRYHRLVVRMSQALGAILAETIGEDHLIPEGLREIFDDAVALEQAASTVKVPE